MRDLDVENLAPIYEATGKKWKFKFFIWDDDSEIERIEKAELINGSVKRTPLKQASPGRVKGYRKPVQKGEKEKLVKGIQEAARRLRSKGLPVRHTAIARALSLTPVHRLYYQLRKHELNLSEIIADS